MVRATFMNIDSGIDTGQIIHQIRTKMYVGDSPHTIGNRLIREMTSTYAQIICKVTNLEIEKQPICEGKVYQQQDLTADACKQLYLNFT